MARPKCVICDQPADTVRVIWGDIHHEPHCRICALETEQWNSHMFQSVKSVESGRAK